MYIGMNFKEWCSLDIEDTRKMIITLKTSNDIFYYNSDEEIEYIDMLLLQSSIITDIKLIKNKWYISLEINNK